jgi:hypothetical protein
MSLEGGVGLDQDNRGLRERVDWELSEIRQEGRKQGGRASIECQKLDAG